jgi:chemotaxis response regulator CheB
VAVGASAGGLEAFLEFLRQLPDAPGLAVVFVQHLDPRHASSLAEILARHTALSVCDAADGMPLARDRVHVIPPDRGLALQSGVLRLLSRPLAPARHMPIDYFRRALAEDQGPNAVGVILSGTGTDSAIGVKAIKAAGGHPGAGRGERRLQRDAGRGRGDRPGRRRPRGPRPGRPCAGAGRRLPETAARAPAPEAHPADPDAPPAAAAAAARIRLVLADDHQIVRDGLVSLLSAGPDIEIAGVAADGEEALLQVAALHPDVAVVDVTMPVPNGIEATRRMRALCPETQVVGLSLLDEQVSPRRRR